MLRPFLLKPACKDYLWGGEQLKTLYHKHTDITPLAETWECSVHPDGPSTIITGPYAGYTLREFLCLFPQAMGRHGKMYGELPILIKLIDAEKDLSIQVHPDDAYAKKHEGQLGKTELWYVLRAQAGATLVYGFAHDVTPQLVRQTIAQNTLMRHMQAVPVHEGDVFLIEPGTIHAIGGGVLLAEVQESSNITYRVYDYGRRDKLGNLRQLHIEKALSVMNFKAAPLIRQHQRIIQYAPGMAKELVGRCRYFQVERLRTTGRCVVPTTEETCYAMVIFSGRGKIITEGEQLSVQKGDTVFVPACQGELLLEGDLEMLLVQI